LPVQRQKVNNSVYLINIFGALCAVILLVNSRKKKRISDQDTGRTNSQHHGQIDCHRQPDDREQHGHQIREGRTVSLSELAAVNSAWSPSRARSWVSFFVLPSEYDRVFLVPYCFL
jgi:hypothetical protein